MATLQPPVVLKLSGFTLDAAPASFSAPASTSLSAPSTSKLLSSGPAFHSHARRAHKGLTFADEDKQFEAELAAGNGVVEEVDDDAELGNEKESREILLSDPKEWKKQDHYEVLGLQNLRYKATEEQIKKAHRRKVLRHHPDKKASAGGAANDDSFFKCIAKAMEVLSNPEKRRQFDSVDEEVPDDVPTAKETTSDNFFELWGPVFEREGRFSKEQPVPALGDATLSKKEVESVYDFWYTIDSWRSFEYLDKDAPEGTDSRDEKRHQEKKNKAERARKKKEDNTRIREFVDRALSLDPRIKQFKADEKAARDAKKNKGQGGVVKLTPAQKAAEEKAAKEAAAKQAEEDAKKAAEAKVARAGDKKAKEAAKKNLKKDKKAISNLVSSHNYFASAGESLPASTVEEILTELDLILNGLEPEDVAALKKEVEAASGGADSIKAAIVAAGKKSPDAAKLKQLA